MLINIVSHQALAEFNCLNKPASFRSLKFLLFGIFICMQITERKSEFAKLESIDCGKPLEEAAWDMVYSDTIRDIKVQYLLYCPF